MLMIGLTGGIGAGKSAVASRLADRGAVIIDADRIARDVVAPGTEGLRAVTAAFGGRVLAPDGALDRPALAATVFGDDNARRTLERIIHPLVRARSAQLAAAAAPDAIVVNDVPLLVESGLAGTYHLVVVVDAALDVRVRRLVEHRGMTDGQAQARMRAQAGDAVRRAAADVLLSNDGSLAELDAAVARLWDERLVPYEAHLRLRRPAPVPAGPPTVEPDPGWPEQAARLITRIRHAVGAADQRVDHIGATAVSGLPAPDVLHLQVGVATPADADRLAAPLAAAGFPRLSTEPPSRPPADGSRDARTAEEPGAADPLHAAADPGRPATVRVRVTGSPGWRLALLLRDHLQADAAHRAAYAAVMARAGDAAGVGRAGDTAGVGRAADAAVPGDPAADGRAWPAGWPWSAELPPSAELQAAAQDWAAATDWRP